MPSGPTNLRAFHSIGLWLAFSTLPPAARWSPPASCPVGIILTASHNPIEWNALKFVGPDGIFLDSVAGTRVREWAAADSLPRANYDAIGGVEADSDAISRHLAAVLGLRGVDVRAIRRRRFRVALDTVRGAGGAVM